MTIPAQGGEWDITLEVSRGEFVSGQVIDPAGNPVRGVDLKAWARDLPGHVPGRSRPDGKFVIGPLPPRAKFTLEVAGGPGIQGFKAPEPIEVRADQKDVIVRLKPLEDR
ncbi:MAG: carboxypeptidase-like regulatory domain-containing protein [Planctomycetota bacterium]